MNLYTDISALPAFRNPVVTIGTFDGVHLGHQLIIRKLKEEARGHGGESVLVTFDPHPRKIVSHKPLQLINTLPEKVTLLRAQGIDNLVVVPFTQAFSSQPATAYAEDFLMGKFRPHTVIIGYDHRFGKGREGDFKLLEAYAANGSFKLIEIPVHLVDEAAISSTKIREHLLQGKTAEARRLLGYTYFFSGIVVTGNQLGRTIGFPTANLQPETEDKLIPGNGVYAVTVNVMPPGTDRSEEPSSTTSFGGMMNIGVRPTVGGIQRVIEVNLFNFNQDIYGQRLKVTLGQWLRPEIKFNGLDALQQQLAKDREAAATFLATAR